MEAAYKMNKSETKRKANENCKNDYLETALMIWIREVPSLNITLTGAILKEK